MEIIIKNSIDVKTAQKLNSWLNRPLVQRVKIELSNLSATETKKAEKKINYLFNDCGCFYGELVLLSFLILKILSLVSTKVFEWHMLISIIPIGILLGIIGKFVGLLWSYILLNYWLQKIEKLYNESY